VAGQPEARVVVGHELESGRRKLVQEFTLGPLRVRHSMVLYKGIPTRSEAEVSRLGCGDTRLRLASVEPADGSDLVLRKGPHGVYSVSVRTKASGDEREKLLAGVRRQER
jgi:hypothetical protein